MKLLYLKNLREVNKMKNTNTIYGRDIDKHIGKYILKAISDDNYELDEFAETIGVSQQTLMTFLSGVHHSTKVLDKCIDILHLDIRTILHNI